MTTAMLLPIHPKWANLIYDGSKTIEVRRRFPMVEDMTVLFYETRPVGMVTGRAVITRVKAATVGDVRHRMLWLRLGRSFRAFARSKGREV